MTDQELAAIEDRAEAATPGPWSWHGKAVIKPGDLGEYEDIVCGEGGTPYGIKNAVDGQFIAHSRQDIPALIARVRQLESEIEEMGENLHGWGGY